MATAQEIANKLNHNEIAYLYAAQEIFLMSDIWEDQIVEDIEATGGKFSDDNYIYLDFDVNAQFDQDGVEEVVLQWKKMMEKLNDSDDIITATDMIDNILFNGASITDFHGVVFRTEKDTGSYDYEVHGEDDVEVVDVLESVDYVEITQNILES